MRPEEIVQRQVEAYNARDLDAFVACYTEDVKLYRAHQPEPAIVGRKALAEFYATQRFNRPKLHAQIVNRMVFGNKVVDHERITGVRDDPFDAAAVYEVSGGLIQAAWFFTED